MRGTITLRGVWLCADADLGGTHSKDRSGMKRCEYEQETARRHKNICTDERNVNHAPGNTVSRATWKMVTGWVRQHILLKSKSSHPSVPVASLTKVVAASQSVGYFPFPSVQIWGQLWLFPKSLSCPKPLQLPPLVSALFLIDRHVVDL